MHFMVAIQCQSIVTNNPFSIQVSSIFFFFSLYVCWWCSDDQYRWRDDNIDWIDFNGNGFDFGLQFVSSTRQISDVIFHFWLVLLVGYWLLISDSICALDSQMFNWIRILRKNFWNQIQQILTSQRLNRLYRR